MSERQKPSGRKINTERVIQALSRNFTVPQIQAALELLRPFQGCNVLDIYESLKEAEVIFRPYGPTIVLPYMAAQEILRITYLRRSYGVRPKVSEETSVMDTVEAPQPMIQPDHTRRERPSLASILTTISDSTGEGSDRLYEAITKAAKKITKNKEPILAGLIAASITFGVGQAAGRRGGPTESSTGTTRPPAELVLPTPSTAHSTAPNRTPTITTTQTPGRAPNPEITAPTITSTTPPTPSRKPKPETTKEKSVPEVPSNPNESHTRSPDERIVDTAAYLTWLYGHDKNKYIKEMLRVFDITKDTYAAQDSPETDCYEFVSFILHASGVDTKAPLRGTPNGLAYFQRMSKSGLYEEVYPSSPADLLPADVLIRSKVYRNGSHKGHAYIFVGLPGPDGKPGTKDDVLALGASWYDHGPRKVRLSLTDRLDGKTVYFHVFRFKGKPSRSTALITQDSKYRPHRTSGTAAPILHATGAQFPFAEEDYATDPRQFDD